AEPWKVIKTDEERVKTVLNVGLQIAANLAVLAQPFLPFTARKMTEMLRLDKCDWEQAGNSTLLPAGHQLGEAQLLFEKITDDQITAQLAKLSTAVIDSKKPTVELVDAKDPIEFEDFVKMDI